MTRAERLAGLFLRPVDHVAGPLAERSLGGQLEPQVVLGAEALVVATGLAILRSRGGPAVLVRIGAPAGAAARAPLAGRRARRLAGRLAARELPATARGRIVAVACDETAHVHRALAAAGEVPVVLAVQGVRDADVDGLLAAAPAVVAASADQEPALSELALATLPPGSLAVTVAVPAVERELATAGWLVGPALRAALRPLLEVRAWG